MNETLFTTAIILGAVTISIKFFVLLHKKKHAKKLAQQQEITADIIRKNKLEISIQETVNNYILAIDKTNFVLLYIKFGDHKEEVTLIDLCQAKGIKVSSEDNSIYEQRKGKSVLIDKQVSQLHLEITLNDVQEKTTLVLYEYKDGMQNLLEIKRRADCWCQYINKAILELGHTATRDTKYA